MEEEIDGLSNYRGERALSCVERLIGGISPEAFYDRFVCTRRPVVLQRAHFSELQAFDRWKDEYLCMKAGDCSVRVEYRTGGSGRYGKGLEKTIKFGDFVNLLAQGREDLYMTTQELEYSIDGRPALVSAPVTKLQDDFPIRPKLLGKLVPQNLNMWMGQSSTSETTSGLHHDFHDNLYILLRGEKRFLLFPPTDAPMLATTGTIVKLHPNGRINYQGQVTRADGAHMRAEAARIASETLNAAVVNGASEDDIEDALEALLDAEMDYEDGEDDRENEEEDEEEDEGGETEGHKLFKYKTATDSDDEAVVGHNRKRRRSTTEDVATGAAETPANFSRIDESTMSSEEIATKFPKFAYARSRALEVKLKPGEMLFLPAGWFHEVFSRRSHLAFNYWLHPPDCLDKGSFDRPYSSPFWEDDFCEREKQKDIKAFSKE